MKKLLVIILPLFILTSCFGESEKDQKITQLNQELIQQYEEIKELKDKIETKETIRKFQQIAEKKKIKILEWQLEKAEDTIDTLKTQRKNLILKKHFQQKEIEETIAKEEEEEKNKKIEIPEEKILDIKFYSQAIKWDFSDPYQNFCEEASFLNWYYYLTWQEPDLKEYNEDLLKIKKIEDLVLEWWYKHTSLQDTLEFIIAFQWEEQKVVWEIIDDPTIDIIRENIAKWNPVIVPIYWKWVDNNYFLGWWPVYHNLVIKWYKDDIFVTNEVWVSRWDWYMYRRKVLMDNIFNFDEDLYPDRFKEWKKQILVLSKAENEDT